MLAMTTRSPDPKASEADTFDKFPHSLMVGNTSNAGTISMFTNDGVAVHKEANQY